MITDDAPYMSFANRLIEAFINKGYTVPNASKRICIKTLAELTEASEQICRRYIRGEALPNYHKIKQLADHLEISPGWLLFGEERHTAAKQIDKAVLHYILKKSHYLYPVSEQDNNDYADFVLHLMEELTVIDTSVDNLFKIVDVAIGSVCAHAEKRKIQIREQEV